jgi:hypothetical protein
MEAAIPILEFDPADDAVLDPHKLIDRIEMPEHCVVCFFQDVIARLVEVEGARVLAHQRSEIGLHPVYDIEFKGRRVAFFHPGVGAPLAAGLLEEVIALGGRKFIACGGAGVLDGGIGGDDVTGDQWDSRDWTAKATVREKLFWLAAEACLSL